MAAQLINLAEWKRAHAPARPLPPWLQLELAWIAMWTAWLPEARR